MKRGNNTFLPHMGFAANVLLGQFLSNIYLEFANVRHVRIKTCVRGLLTLAFINYYQYVGINTYVLGLLTLAVISYYQYICIDMYVIGLLTLAVISYYRYVGINTYVPRLLTLAIVDYDNVSKPQANVAGKPTRLSQSGSAYATSSYFKVV